MKLIYPTPSACRLQIQPWGGRAFGMLFFLIGLCVGFFLFTSVSLHCPGKKAGSALACELKEKIAHVYHSTTPIGDLTGTRVESVYQPPSNNHQGSYSYQVLLLTKAMPSGIAFSELKSSNYDDVQQIAKVVDMYITQSNNPEIKLPSANPWWTLLFPVIFIVVGIHLILTSSKVQLDLDKNLRTVVLYRKSMMRSTTDTYKFEQILQFFVDSRWSSNSNNSNGIQFNNQNGGQQVYALVLELVNHQRIQITFAYDNFYHNKAKIAEQLNSWIQTSSNVNDTFQ